MSDSATQKKPASAKDEVALLALREEQTADILRKAEEKAEDRVPELANYAWDQFLKNYTGRSLVMPEKPGFLNGRYKIFLDKPLPLFSKSLAKACRAIQITQAGTGQYVALVCKRRGLYQKELLEVVHKNKLTGLMRPLAHGNVYFEEQEAYYYVQLYQNPGGQKLIDVVKNRKRPVPENIVMKQILRPLHQALDVIHRNHHSHGCINLNTIYYNSRKAQKVTLGECFSEPMGLSQKPLFEAIEISMASGVGKGQEHITADYYALGMVAFLLLSNQYDLQTIGEETWIRRRLREGTPSLLRNLELSQETMDFLRGTLLDNPAERWGREQMERWLGGQNFNLVQPAPPHQAPRPYNFNNQEHFNHRTLAYDIGKAPKKAVQSLKNEKFLKWLELAIGKKFDSSILQRLVSYVESSRGNKGEAEIEITARASIVLFPPSPLRYKDIACHLDGIGNIFIEAFLDDDREKLFHLKNIITSSLDEFWVEQQSGELPGSISQVSWALQRVRNMLTNSATGFGAERALYELNPHLPCLSPLVVDYHIEDLASLMVELDRLAPLKYKECYPVDRHIAAFIAYKLDAKNEIRLTALDNMSHLKGCPELNIIAMLSRAQRNVKEVGELYGLCAWCLAMLENMLERIYGNHAREEIAVRLKRVAKSGQIIDLCDVFTNGDVITRDVEGFTKAMDSYCRNIKKIEDLSNRKIMFQRAHDFGARLAFYVSFIVSMIVSTYYLIR